MCDHRLKLWNTIATRDRMRSIWRRSAGSMRPRASRRSAIRSPPISTSPESGASSMLMQRSRVDLPEPEAPKIAITFPTFASSETPRNTSSVPKLLRRSRTETAESDMRQLKNAAQQRAHRAGAARADVPAPGPPVSRQSSGRDRSPRTEEDLDRAISLGNQLVRDAGDLHQGDGGGERGRLD